MYSHICRPGIFSRILAQILPPQSTTRTRHRAPTSAHWLLPSSLHRYVCVRVRGCVCDVTVNWARCILSFLRPRTRSCARRCTCMCMGVSDLAVHRSRYILSFPPLPHNEKLMTGSGDTIARTLPHANPTQQPNLRLLHGSSILRNTHALDPIPFQSRKQQGATGAPKPGGGDSAHVTEDVYTCLLYTSPSPRD